MNHRVQTIYIIDDFNSYLYLLQYILSEEGYNVVVEKNASVALKNIEEKVFDLILLDLVTPKINGLKVLEKIKNGSKNVNTPVIIISAKSDSKSIKNTLDIGASDYITKPFNTVDIINKTKLALQNKTL